MVDILRELAVGIAAALAPVIAGLVVAILARALRRLGLEVSAWEQARLEKLVQDAILRAEEWAAARRKLGAAIPSSDVLRRATEDVAARVDGSPEEIRQLIWQELPKLGLGASGPVLAASRAGHGRPSRGAS